MTCVRVRGVAWHMEQDGMSGAGGGVVGGYGMVCGGTDGVPEHDWVTMVASVAWHGTTSSGQVAGSVIDAVDVSCAYRSLGGDFKVDFIVQCMVKND